MEKPLIVIGSSNGSYNLGDSSMWEAAVHIVRRNRPELAIITDAKEGWTTPIPKVSVLPLLHEEFKRWRGVSSSRFNAAARLFVNSGSVGRGINCASAFVRGQMSGSVAESWYKAIDGASGIVFSGAGGITDDYALHGVAGWSAIARRASRMGKPVAFIGQGIGPIRSNSVRREAMRMFDSASLVTTRDKISLDVLRGLGYAGACESTPDWAIALQVSDWDRCEARRLHSELCEDNHFVAVSFHDRQGAPRKDVERLGVWLETIAKVAIDRNLSVVCIPNCTSFRRSDDRVLMLSLIARLPDSLKERVSLVKERITPAVSRALLGRSRGLISTRYHPIVFALAEGTPAGGLSFDPYYDQKLQGALRWYGEEYRVRSVNSNPSVDEEFIVEILSADERQRRCTSTSHFQSEITDPFEVWLSSEGIEG